MRRFERDGKILHKLPQRFHEGIMTENNKQEAVCGSMAENGNERLERNARDRAEFRSDSSKRFATGWGGRAPRRGRIREFPQRRSREY